MGVEKLRPESRKGQVFVIAAILLSSLILLLVLSYQQIIITESQPDYRFYFQNALNQQPVALNRQLGDNYSVEEVRKEMYSFNSFVDRRSSERQVDFMAYQLMLLPEKDTALMINYRESSTDYSFHDGTWDNDSIDAMQYRTFSIPEDRRNFALDATELDINEKFSASEPTLLGFMEMAAENEKWRNYVIR